MSLQTASRWQQFLLFHLAMLAISTSGPLGRVVAMPPLLVIFWRATLAAILFGIVCWWQNRDIRIAPADRGRLLLSGVLMGVHWVTYFQALQLSNVAIGMLSLFTFPVFTALLEPLLLKTRFEPVHLLLGALTLVGIYCLVPTSDVANTQLQAIGWGLLSALSYALRNVLSKSQVAHYPSMVLMFYQITIIAIMLLPLAWWQEWGTIVTEWPMVLALAIITTLIGHTLFLNSFRYFTATTASIMSCSQPIYGILLGIVFLRELPAWSTVLGGVLILLAVVIESRRVR